jgi:hypothetical protein
MVTSVPGGQKLEGLQALPALDSSELISDRLMPVPCQAGDQLDAKDEPGTTELNDLSASAKLYM